MAGDECHLLDSKPTLEYRADEFFGAMDAHPVRTANGYICRECLPEEGNAFSSREALWKNHLFEPLLEWINDELATAKALGIYATSDRSGTWAKLLGTGENPESDCLIAKVPLASRRCELGYSGLRPY
jgi:hypothetical protein